VSGFVDTDPERLCAAMAALLVDLPLAQRLYMRCADGRPLLRPQAHHAHQAAAGGRGPPDGPLRSGQHRGDRPNCRNLACLSPHSGLATGPGHGHLRLRLRRPHPRAGDAPGTGGRRPPPDPLRTGGCHWRTHPFRLAAAVRSRATEGN
jgi:hypothetical protein